MSYLERPYLWLPPTQSSSAHRLAALLSPNPEPIRVMDDYLYLLADKVEWLIQRQENLEEAYEMICGFLGYGVFQMLEKPEREANTTQWAWSVTLYNSPLQDCLMNLSPVDMPPGQTFLDFPLSFQSMDSLTQERMQEMMLEEWLSSMSVHCHPE